MVNMIMALITPPDLGTLSISTGGGTHALRAECEYEYREIHDALVSGSTVNSQ